MCFLASSSSAQLRQRYPLTIRIDIRVVVRPPRTVTEGETSAANEVGGAPRRTHPVKRSLEARHVPVLFPPADQRDLAEQEEVGGDARLDVGFARTDADRVVRQELTRFTLALDHAGFDQKIHRGDAFTFQARFG